MPSNALVTAALLVLAPSVALGAVPVLRTAPEGEPPPRAPATSGTAPPTRSIGGARLPTAPRAGPARDGWIWPLSPRPAVLRGFSPGPYPWSAGHRGVDLATRPGATVVAPAAGVVTFARDVVNRPVLVITHDNGVRTGYEPVAAAVPSGSRVGRGTVIGKVVTANGHCRPRACLHWSARRGGRYRDPLSFLAPPRIVLLPMPHGPPGHTG